MVKEFEEKSARREPCSEAEGREHHKVVGVEGLGKVNTGKTCTAKQEEQGAAALKAHRLPTDTDTHQCLPKPPQLL